MRSLTSELACAGVLLQDRGWSPCSKIEHRKLSDPFGIEMTKHVMEWNQRAAMEIN
jgi:hypothetical protein